MRAETCARIQALRPRRILDLGCGGGILLFPLAPTCEEYVAVDFSPEAIADVGREITRLGIDGVRLLEQQVDEPTNIPADTFDVVLLNTVVQYFPDADYLEAVLENALRALRPGGAVFIGDIRELAALETFHASIVMAAAGRDKGLQSAREEFQRISGRETELAFDPGWFEAFGEAHPEVTNVEIAYKHGPDSNELIDYRYDAILRKGGGAVYAEPDRVYICDGDRRDLAAFWDRLIQEPADLVLVRNLVNARRLAAFGFLNALQVEDGESSSQAIPEIDPSAALDPHDVVRNGEARGYRVVLLPDSMGSPVRFEALLVHDGPNVTIWSHRPARDRAPQPPARLTNELQQCLAAPSSDHAPLIANLQHLAESRLPAPMCPAHYVILRELPLTPSGKLDRNALPTPLNSRPQLTEELIEPRDALELQLAHIFSEKLGVSPVGVRDRFFDLGGDSLATVEVLLTIEDRLGLAVDMGHFLERPTVEGVSAIINERLDFRPATALVTLKPGGASKPLYFHSWRRRSCLYGFRAGPGADL